MALVDYVDEFVVADSFAVSRRSCHNRTPIRTPDGWMWLTLPLQRPCYGRPICEVAVKRDGFWPGKHWRALRYNYSSTPFFHHYADDLEDMLHREWESLANLTFESMRMTAQWLGISTRLSRLDSGEGDLAAAAARLRGTRAIAAAESAEHDARSYAVAETVAFGKTPYAQNFPGFERDLSALDLLFNWGPEALGLLRERREVAEVSQADVKPAAPRLVC